MRAWGGLVAALAVATLSCKGKPKDLGPTREVRADLLVLQVAGPFDLEDPDTIYTGFMTVENRNSATVYASIEGCGISLERGERRGCYSLGKAEGDKRSPIQSTTREKRLRLKLEEMSLVRTARGHARFAASVINDDIFERRVDARVRFDVVDEENRLVGAAQASPVKSSLAPRESSMVHADVLLAKGAKGKLSIYAPVADSARGELNPESTPSATLTDLTLQASTRRKQWAAVITNTSAVPIRPQVRFYLKDKKNRAVAGEICTDDVRDVAPAPLAPGESTPCTAPLRAELPPYDRIEVEATPAAAWGTPVTLTPLKLKEVKVDGGFIHVAVETPAPKMGFYIRAKPEWLYIDYANDKTPYAYHLDGATSAEVTAFAVGGPPNESWVPLRQFGKSD